MHHCDSARRKPYVLRVVLSNFFDESQKHSPIEDRSATFRVVLVVPDLGTGGCINCEEY